MKSELLNAFDALVPYCEVSAALCEAASKGSLDIPLDLHSICTRVGLPQARAADIERSLIAGQVHGMFMQSTPLTWSINDSTLATRLAPLLLGVRLYRSRAKHSRDIRQQTIVQVHDELPILAVEQPQVLMELHAEIERVSLQKMIDKYREMLGKNLTESIWQRFFDRNIFILTMLFCGPVHLVCSQFHAQPSGITGKGAQIGDYLFRGIGQALAIVEIKKPDTPLIQKREYRSGGGVHAPDSELSGAVSQVLYQRHSLQSAWSLHRENGELLGTRPDNTRCVIIAGTLPTEEKILRSFETFRCAYKDVEVVTFDELLQKLEHLLDLLSP
ncbi:TPA: Shedu immune nuclease family protein [Serratia fonticola]